MNQMNQMKSSDEDVQVIYPCSYCKKVYSFLHELEKHLEEKHQAPKPYGCKTCNKNFAVQLSLKDHLSNMHSMQMSYECLICNMQFSSALDLEKHLSTHRVDHLKCNVCPYNCGHYLALCNGPKPNKKRIKKKEEPFRCAQCTQNNEVSSSSMTASSAALLCQPGPSGSKPTAKASKSRISRQVQNLYFEVIAQKCGNAPIPAPAKMKGTRGRKRAVAEAEPAEPIDLTTRRCNSTITRMTKVDYQLFSFLKSTPPPKA